MKMKPRGIRLLLVLIAIILTGCSEIVVETPVESLTQIPIQPTASLEPTEAPTLPTLLLVAGPQSSPELLAAVEPVAIQLAGESGLFFERRQELTVESAPADLRVAVILPPDPGLAGLAGALPETQFVAIGIPDLTPGENLTVIGMGGQQDNFQGFMAGYIAAMQASEWRVGLIGVADDAGRIYQQTFVNGAIYYCGFCNPVYPPYNDYPLVVEVGVGASLYEKQQIAETLLSQSITAVHIDPRAAEPQLWLYLAERGMLLVGDGPPPDGTARVWLASVEVGETGKFQETLAAVIQRGAQGLVSAPLAFTHLNPQQISAGRLSLLENILQMLVDGTIDPVGD